MPYDLSKVQIGSDGMVQTSANTSVGRDSLSDSGYQQALGYKTANPTVTPTVISSGPATDHLNDIKTQHADIVTGLNNHAAAVTASKTAADEATRLAKESADKNALEQAKINSKNKLIDVATDKVPGQDELDTNKQTLADTSDDYYVKAKSVTDTIDSIRSGAIPLNEGEQAQVDGLKQQFQSLIDAQGLQNKSAASSANTRGYQKGSAEYDPTFQIDTIGKIVTAGINKVTDLNIKMASAISTLTNSIKTENINGIKSAWDVYNTAAKTRMETLQKTIADSSKAVVTTQKAMTQSVRDNAVSDLVSKGVTDPNDLLKQLNFDTQGNQVGDFTAKEIGATLKGLADKTGLGDITKLTGETKNFAILKAEGMLPKDIADLPEGDQMFAFLKQRAEATRAPKNPTSSSTTKPVTDGKLTYTKADIETTKALLQSGGTFQGKNYPANEAYMNPQLYLDVYNGWIAGGGTTPGFIKNFPPKEHVNPSNTWLPKQLLPTTKKTASASSSGGP